MPAGVVKPGQEHLWNKAKKLAVKQGRAKDWAYINGIFQKMTGGSDTEKCMLSKAAGDERSGHKYTNRTGTVGHYKYTYPDQGDLFSNPSEKKPQVGKEPTGFKPPQVGDKVFAWMPGLFGMPVQLLGEVVSGGKVKITGGVPTNRKFSKLSEAKWTVRDDPYIPIAVRKHEEREKQQRQEKEAKESKRKTTMADIVGRSLADAKARGEVEIQQEEAKAGQIITVHMTPFGDDEILDPTSIQQKMEVVEPGKYLGVRPVGSHETPYTIGNARVTIAAEKLSKSTTCALSPRFILTKWPGQVPSRENIDLLRQTKQMPSEPTLAQMFEPTGKYMRPESVVDGLGLDRAKQNEWIGLLGKALSARNELTVRHELVSKMLADRMAPELRRALFSRALSYYRDMKKSMVQIVTVDELRKSGTGEGSRGGNVVGHAAGGKPIYDSKKIPWPDEQAAAQSRQKHFESQWVSPTGKINKAEQSGAIVDQGEQGDPAMRLERVIRVVTHRLGNAGPEGLSLDKLSDIVKTYGQPLVAQALTKACAQAGSMTFKKGLLQLRSI